MNRPVPDGGYDGEDSDEKEKGPKEVRLERVEHFYSASPPASLRVNGESRGILYLSDDEFEWLKQRVDGEMKSD